MGFPLYDQYIMFGDNESAVNCVSITHAKLYKRYIALSFHIIREAIDTSINLYIFLLGKYNPAVILSRHRGYQ